DDFRFGARRQGDIGMLREAGLAHGFEVAQMESVTVAGIRVSSTAVRERLAQGDLAAAARLLGRPYSITGKVVSGDGLGRQLGFPTANVQMKHNRPALFGIFVVEVSGCGPAMLPGVASLGTRPTVKQGGIAVLEVHLFDFAGDLYGKHLQVHFLDKLRDEETYADLETLKLQIGRDAESARAYFKAKH
ncbi:MAG: riboflavin biosynthesis protein RibF, partial [Betaproteobacteria bacterium]